jgi:hypothetical protein
VSRESGSRWVEANQRHLVAALAGIRVRLEGHVHATGPEAPRAEAHRPAPEGGPAFTEGDVAALDTLSTIFELSDFERDVLLLCAGVELDARLAALCARAHGDARRVHPTFGLALAALDQPHWSALSPARPLRRWRLIEVGSAETLTSAALRIDERVLHYLTGLRNLDDRLAELVQVVPAPDMLVPSHGRLAERLADLFTRRSTADPWAAIQLSGPDHGAKSAIVAAAARALGMVALRLAGGEIPAAAGERASLARLCERELALEDAVLLIDGADGEITEASARRLVAFVEDLAGPTVIAAAEAVPLRRRASARLDVEPPDTEEQTAVWLHGLGPDAGALREQVAAVVGQFRLDGHGVRAACAEAREGLRRGRRPSGLLWEACRVHARRGLDDLAQRIEATAAWEDLVLPEPQLAVLRQAAAQVRRRATVYQRWGFAAKGTRSLGISALFAGASGTGKTMTAEVLANELRLDLYRVDLSQVVSKYIGETEKNLRRIFDTAENSGALLLFDEADALFGKRSEVRDSHDRYANIEVSYLLQRMEAYRGLAILTTNMKDALDPSFLRRLRFVVQFPFPDAGARAQIWRRVFPARTPTAGLDVERLARLQIPGGNIRNIALNAAFLAAEASTPVTMSHVLNAARTEYAKLERTPARAELEGVG